MVFWYRVNTKLKKMKLRGVKAHGFSNILLPAERLKKFYILRTNIARKLITFLNNYRFMPHKNVFKLTIRKGTAAKNTRSQPPRER